MVLRRVRVSLAVAGGRRRGRKGRANGDDAGSELDADGDVVVGDEAAFAEADGEGGFTGAAVADADEFCDVVPWLGHWSALRNLAKGETIDRCEQASSHRSFIRVTQ